MPLPKWQRFEQLVAAIQHVEAQGAIVAWNDSIEGRQFDVTVRFSFGLEEYLTVIECKDKSAKVSVEEVDAFVTKARDAKASKAVMVSSRGYQSGCFPVADRHGVRLLVLTEHSNAPTLPLVGDVTPVLNITEVEFEGNDGSEHELEDAGGKLAFLVLHTKVTLADREVTVDQLLQEWQLGTVIGDSIAPERVRVPFSGGAKVLVPHEEEFQATAMRFRVRQIDAFRATGSVVDAHIRANQQATLELRAADGRTVKQYKLKDLPHGFHTEIEAGKFYFCPLLQSSYYCEAVEPDDILNMTMVESYQHGRFIQAQFTVKRQNAKNYVEIKDMEKLKHLRSLLDVLKKQRAA